MDKHFFSLALLLQDLLLASNKQHYQWHIGGCTQGQGSTVKTNIGKYVTTQT